MAGFRYPAIDALASLLQIPAWHDAAQMRARWDEVEAPVFEWARHLAKVDAAEKGKRGEKVAPQAGFEPAT